jgi:hypothetical protein
MYEGVLILNGRIRKIIYINIWTLDEQTNNIGTTGWLVPLFITHSSVCSSDALTCRVRRHRFFNVSPETSYAWPLATSSTVPARRRRLDVVVQHPRPELCALVGVGVSAISIASTCSCLFAPKIGRSHPTGQTCGPHRSDRCGQSPRNPIWTSPLDRSRRVDQNPYVERPNRSPDEGDMTSPRSTRRTHRSDRCLPDSEPYWGVLID